MRWDFVCRLCQSRVSQNKQSPMKENIAITKTSKNVEAISPLPSYLSLGSCRTKRPYAGLPPIQQMEVPTQKDTKTFLGKNSNKDRHLNAGTPLAGRCGSPVRALPWSRGHHNFHRILKGLVYVINEIWRNPNYGSLGTYRCLCLCVCSCSCLCVGFCLCS